MGKGEGRGEGKGGNISSYRHLAENAGKLMNATKHILFMIITVVEGVSGKGIPPFGLLAAAYVWGNVTILVTGYGGYLKFFKGSSNLRCLAMLNPCEHNTCTDESNRCSGEDNIPYTSYEDTMCVQGPWYKLKFVLELVVFNMGLTIEDHDARTFLRGFAVMLGTFARMPRQHTARAPANIVIAYL